MDGRDDRVDSVRAPSGGRSSQISNLCSGTTVDEPPIRLLAMPVPSMVFAFGVELLLIDGLRLAGVRAPVRISSLPRGSPLRPGIYSIIEDVVAVDGSGGTEFRQRLNLRYQASHYFRQMLHRLTIFWAVGACIVAAITTALIFTIQKDAAYVVSIPVMSSGCAGRANSCSRRLAGPSRSSGPEYGPSLQSSGSRGVWCTKRLYGAKSTQGSPRGYGAEACQPQAFSVLIRRWSIRKYLVFQPCSRFLHDTRTSVHGRSHRVSGALYHRSSGHPT